MSDAADSIYGGLEIQRGRSGCIRVGRSRRGLVALDLNSSVFYTQQGIVSLTVEPGDTRRRQEGSIHN